MHCASRRLPARAAPTLEEKQKNRVTLRVAPAPAARCADTRKINRPVQLHCALRQRQKIMQKT
ncbi:hypothetical protein A2U01_0112097, partial [Trifolium medium]|nr:hypothetical protein [Trifolium medium]